MVHHYIQRTIKWRTIKWYTIIYSAPLNGAHLNGAPLINGASLNTARGKRWTYSKRAPHNGCGCDFFLEPAKSYNIAKFCFPAPPFRKKRWCENKNGLILFLKLFLKKRWPKFRHISRHSKQLSEHMREVPPHLDIHDEMWRTLLEYIRSVRDFLLLRFLTPPAEPFRGGEDYYRSKRLRRTVSRQKPFTKIRSDSGHFCPWDRDVDFSEASQIRHPVRHR